MEDEEDIQNLKNKIIARDNIIELYKRKYNDPFIENEIQKLQMNENQNFLFKNNFNDNKDNLISQMRNKIENLEKENNDYKMKLQYSENEINKYKFDIEKIRNKIYKEQMEQTLKQHCDDKMNAISNALNEALKKKIEFFLQKYEKIEKKSSVCEQNSGKVKELEEFIMNLKREIDQKVLNFNFNQPKAIEKKNSIQDKLSSQKLTQNHYYYGNNTSSNIHENLIISNTSISSMNEISFECLTKSPLLLEICEGAEKGEIEIFLKNNGPKTWPEGEAKLICERESKINSEEVLLRPQKPNEIRKYIITLKKLENLAPNQYNLNLGFYFRDDEIGEQIILTIDLKKKITNNIHYL